MERAARRRPVRGAHRRRRGRGQQRPAGPHRGRRTALPLLRLRRPHPPLPARHEGLGAAAPGGAAPTVTTDATTFWEDFYAAGTNRWSGNPNALLVAGVE